MKHHSTCSLASIFVSTCAVFGGILAVQSQADELPRGVFRLTGVEVSAIDRIREGKKIHDKKSDKLTYWVRFDIRSKAKMVAGREQERMKILNPMKPSALMFDKVVHYKGKDVAAGTNLLQFVAPGATKPPRIDLPSLNPMAIGSLRLGKEFAFPAKDYQVRFEWEATTGETLSDTVDVTIDLGKE